MTGNATLAKQIYDLDQRYWNNSRHANKAGFRMIGKGGTRQVYLGPDGFAYKVGDEECNLREAKASRQLRGNRQLANLSIHVPRARTYRVDGGYFVCAMDFIPSAAKVECKSYYYDDVWSDDRCNCGSKGKTKHVCFGKVLKYLDDFGIDDMFSGNIIYSTDNRFYLIDLGYQGA